jgi:hypothetical protein
LRPRFDSSRNYPASNCYRPEWPPPARTRGFKRGPPSPPHGRSPPGLNDLRTVLPHFSRSSRSISPRGASVKRTPIYFRGAIKHDDRCTESQIQLDYGDSPLDPPPKIEPIEDLEGLLEAAKSGSSSASSHPISAGKTTQRPLITPKDAPQRLGYADGPDPPHPSPSTARTLASPPHIPENNISSGAAEDIHSPRAVPALVTADSTSLDEQWTVVRESAVELPDRSVSPDETSIGWSCIVACEILCAETSSRLLSIVEERGSNSTPTRASVDSRKQFTQRPP